MREAWSNLAVVTAPVVAVAAAAAAAAGTEAVAASSLCVTVHNAEVARTSCRLCPPHPACERWAVGR